MQVNFHLQHGTWIQIFNRIRFTAKRCAQLIFYEHSFLNIISADSDFMGDMGTDS